MTALNWNQVLEEIQKDISRPDLKQPGEPFSQANLFFEQPVNERLDADQDGDVEELAKGHNPRLTHQMPSKHSTKPVDAHSYQAQGEEPPPEPIASPSPFVRLVSFTALGICGVALWAAWVTLWPDFIKLLLWVAGR